MNLNQDSIGRAFSISWKVAHDATTKRDWVYRWGCVESELYGVWLAINYSEAPDLELMDDLSVLRRIAADRKSGGTQ